MNAKTNAEKCWNALKMHSCKNASPYIYQQPCNNETTSLKSSNYGGFTTKTTRFTSATTTAFHPISRNTGIIFGVFFFGEGGYNCPSEPRGRLFFHLSLSLCFFLSMVNLCTAASALFSLRLHISRTPISRIYFSESAIFSRLKRAIKS